MDIPPNSSCPPLFALITAFARRIAPAHVPQTGLTFTKFRKGSNSPVSRARRAIVVDSDSSGEIWYLDQEHTSSGDYEGLALPQVLRCANENHIYLRLNRELLQGYLMLHKSTLKS